MTELEGLGENWGWVLAAGIAYLLLGIAAYSWPVGSTLGLTIALGSLFVVGGVIEVIHAFRLRRDAGRGSRAFLAVISLAAGLLMLRYPGAGMVGVAIAMAFYFFASAAAKSVVAVGMRPLKGWGWALFSAVCSFVLGAYIILAFPFSALWVPGLVLGVDFLVYGFSLIGISGRLRKVHRKIDDVTERLRAA